jgi:hypothetical protein
MAGRGGRRGTVLWGHVFHAAVPVVACVQGAFTGKSRSGLIINVAIVLAKRITRLYAILAAVFHQADGLGLQSKRRKHTARPAFRRCRTLSGIQSKLGFESRWHSGRLGR